MNQHDPKTGKIKQQLYYFKVPPETDLTKPQVHPRYTLESSIHDIHSCNMSAPNPNGAPTRGRKLAKKPETYIWDDGTMRRLPLRGNYRLGTPNTSLAPLRDYCTQGCLRSLARRTQPDYSCPNMLLHLSGSRGRTCFPIGVKVPQHALTPRKLHKRLQNQLERSTEQDCENRQRSGRVGGMFRLTVTGHGYTLVAKAVRARDSNLLLREKSLYMVMEAQQGVRIPVCMGTIELNRPIVAPRQFVEPLTHMMLMSYVGRALDCAGHERQLEKRGVNVDDEAERTQIELWERERLDETGFNNLTWSEELGRVCRIDFDHAELHKDWESELTSLMEGVSFCRVPKRGNSYDRELVRAWNEKVFDSLFTVPEDYVGVLRGRLPVGRGGWDDCVWVRSPMALVREVRASNWIMDSLLLAN